MSQWAPSKMGVPAKNLGTLSGPHEVMAPEALMEMWSLSRTHLSSSLNAHTATIIDPSTGCCASQQLGYGKSRARSQDLEGSGRLRLDIESYGEATSRRESQSIELEGSIRKTAPQSLAATS